MAAIQYEEYKLKLNNLKPILDELHVALRTDDAKNEIADISLAIAGKVVERELKAEDQSHLIDSFIDALGDAL